MALCLHSPWIVQALVGDGWAAATTLKTPVNVLVILVPLGWETDSVKAFEHPQVFGDLLHIWTSAKSFYTLKFSLSPSVYSSFHLGMFCHTESP